jgi:alcohol dehydrogenase
MTFAAEGLDRVVWGYHNPVRVLFGNGRFAETPHLLAGRRYGLVTYGEPLFDQFAAQVAAIAGPPLAVVNDVQPNPDYALLESQCLRMQEAGEPDVLLALGGGSVIDTAKVLAAARGNFESVAAYLEGRAAYPKAGSIPLVAVPTTAGTGSEVTSWATVWHAATGRKHSLTHPSLYPEVALIDPLLTLGAPRQLTVATGLDALSHALESLWNVNSNPVSVAQAVQAARELIDALPALVEALADLDLRERVARGALLAGLAFSNTKTALAHNISYPITLRYGVPHGLACSFTLPRILRAVAGTDATCDAALRAIFGGDLAAGAQRLDALMERLGVSVAARDYGLGEEEWQAVVEAAFAGERGRNFIGNRERFMQQPG